jgi:hypothetical protein
MYDRIETHPRSGQANGTVGHKPQGYGLSCLQGGHIQCPLLQFNTLVFFFLHISTSSSSTSTSQTSFLTDLVPPVGLPLRLYFEPYPRPHAVEKLRLKQ